LKNFPSKYIYAPWTAPIAVQKQAGCIIGEHYPKPIVDHKEASNKCKARMKAAYEGNTANNETGVAVSQEDGNVEGGEEGMEPPPKTSSAKKTANPKKQKSITDAFKSATSNKKRKLKDEDDDDEDFPG
jgi:cryptochrome